MEFRRQAKKGEEESDAGFSPSYTDLGSHTNTKPLSVMQKYSHVVHRLRMTYSHTDYGVTPSVTWKPRFLNFGTINILDWTVLCFRGLPCALLDV